VAICRLKRVAVDYKGDIRDRLPRPAELSNGKGMALIGAGSASLTVARGATYIPTQPRDGLPPAKPAPARRPRSSATG
jgi:hypothetical protein